jgi:hypothetical protein
MLWKASRKISKNNSDYVGGVHGTRYRNVRIVLANSPGALSKSFHFNSVVGEQFRVT